MTSTPSTDTIEAEPIEAELVSSADAPLVKYAGEVGLQSSATTPLVEAFRPIFIEARKALKSSLGVAESVKDATCVTEIKHARACRLVIRKVRIAGEKVRKEQKATALAYGKAVDGFYNILAADLDPVEKALQDAEDTAERLETARKDALEVTRRTALTPFVATPDVYQVRDMDEDSFNVLLTGVRLAKEATEAATKQAAADALAAEQTRLAVVARVNAENERLKAEAAAAKVIADAALAKAEADRVKAAADAKAALDAVEAKAKVERDALAAKAAADVKIAKDAADVKAKADKAAQDAKDAAARAEQAKKDAAAKVIADAAAATAAREKALREKAEADLQAVKDKEAAAIVAADTANRAAARKAASAGDKTKLNVSIVAIRAATPTLKDPALQERVTVWFDTMIGALQSEHDAL